jgi:monothiol glutaredoxin
MFIRGSPTAPACKSSKYLVDKMEKMDITFKSFDIQEDPRMKEWLRFYANWPSFPQLYIYGRFVGGTEIVLQLFDQEEFMPMVPHDCVKANALERIKAALKKSIVVVFIKGSESNPFDGYQKEAVQIL